MMDKHSILLTAISSIKDMNKYKNFINGYMDKTAGKEKDSSAVLGIVKDILKKKLWQKVGEEVTDKVLPEIEKNISEKGFTREALIEPLIKYTDKQTALSAVDSITDQVKQHASKFKDIPDTFREGIFKGILNRRDGSKNEVDLKEKVFRGGVAGSIVPVVNETLSKLNPVKAAAYTSSILEDSSIDNIHNNLTSLLQESSGLSREAAANTVNTIMKDNVVFRKTMGGLGMQAGKISKEYGGKATMAGLSKVLTSIAAKKGAGSMAMSLGTFPAALTGASAIDAYKIYTDKDYFDKMQKRVDNYRDYYQDKKTVGRTPTGMGYGIDAQQAVQGMSPAAHFKSIADTAYGNKNIIDTPSATSAQAGGNILLKALYNALAETPGMPNRKGFKEVAKNPQVLGESLYDTGNWWGERIGNTLSPVDNSPRPKLSDMSRLQAEHYKQMRKDIAESRKNIADNYSSYTTPQQP